MARIILPLLLFVSGCSSLAPHDDWSKADTRRQIAYSTALAFDAMTTARIHRRDDLVEGNPIARAVLGPKPAPAETFVAAALSGALHYVISRRMKPERRRIFQYVAFGIHAEALHTNCDNGLC